MMTQAQGKVSSFIIDGSPLYFQSTSDAPKPPPNTYRTSAHEKPSLDLPSRLERKLAEYNASQNYLKRWLFEITSVTTSAVCIGAIIGILYYINDKSLNTWSPGLTIITILSKVASAALILPISEAIGQLKWTWFHGKRSRDAFDFEIFDKASRGAWGSFMLLCRTKGKSLAALGALLTILLLAIDTFFQQVTDLPERWKLQGESFIPRVVHYEPLLERQYEGEEDQVPIATTNNEIRSGMQPFFFNQNGTRPLTNGNATQPEIPLICPTGRCEWPSYKTLGVCSACEDVSNLLEYACLSTKMNWIRLAIGPKPNETIPRDTACGYFLNATSDDPVLMSGFRVNNLTETVPGETLLMRTLPLVTDMYRKPLYGNGTINFNHVQHRILDALIVSSADGTAESVYRKQRPVAQECMLAWCVKTMRSSYNSGDYQEEVEEVFINSTQAPYPWWSEDIFEREMVLQVFETNISIRPPSLAASEPTFGLSNETFTEFVLILDDIFPSQITVSKPNTAPVLKLFTSRTNYANWRYFRFSPWLAPNNVTFHLERMAQAMTNMIRSDINSIELIAGTAYVRETYVAVHWGWLAFPLAMLLLSIVFLVSTILKTSNKNYEDIGVWKTSAMPTLMYSLPKDAQMDILSTNRARRKVSKRASRVRIRLLPKQGWRVSGQIIAPPPPPPPPPGFF